jgi:MOSC domain
MTDAATVHRAAGRRRPGAGPARLLSVNVGMPKNLQWQGRTVYSGIFKHPVEAAMVRRLNLEGDGQGDRHGHGGEQRAVLVYQIESYRHWEREQGRNDFAYGQFGENLTVDGLADAEVCIGDRYQIGEAEFEVTQPRVTCGDRISNLGCPSKGDAKVTRAYKQTGASAPNRAELVRKPAERHPGASLGHARPQTSSSESRSVVVVSQRRTNFW